MAYKSRLLLCALCACISVVSIKVNAATLYSYTGSTYGTISGTSIVHTFDMAVSGSFILDQPLLPNMQLQLITPISFSIFDGVNTLTDSNVSRSLFKIATDSTGNISNWDIFTWIIPSAVPGFELVMITRGSLDPIAVIDVSTIYYCEYIDEFGFCPAASPLLSHAISTEWSGGWTSSAIIPLPATLWLFGSGLLGLIGVARRKVRV